MRSRNFSIHERERRGEIDMAESRKKQAHKGLRLADILRT